MHACYLTDLCVHLTLIVNALRVLSEAHMYYTCRDTYDLIQSSP